MEERGRTRGGMEVDEGRLGADAPLVDETREEAMLPSAK